jgi:hypothetical protein
VSDSSLAKTRALSFGPAIHSLLYTAWFPSQDWFRCTSKVDCRRFTRSSRIDATERKETAKKRKRDKRQCFHGLILLRGARAPRFRVKPSPAAILAKGCTDYCRRFTRSSRIDATERKETAKKRKRDKRVGRSFDLLSRIDTSPRSSSSTLPSQAVTRRNPRQRLHRLHK